MNGTERGTGNCPVCRKVFHAKDIEHVHSLVGSHSSLVSDFLITMARIHERIPFPFLAGYFPIINAASLLKYLVWYNITWFSLSIKNFMWQPSLRLL